MAGESLENEVAIVAYGVPRLSTLLSPTSFNELLRVYGSFLI